MNTTQRASKVIEGFTHVLNEQILEAAKRARRGAYRAGAQAPGGSLGLLTLLLQPALPGMDRLFGFPSAQVVRMSVTARRAGTCAAVGAVVGAMLGGAFLAALGGGLGGALGGYTSSRALRSKIWF